MGVHREMAGYHYCVWINGNGFIAYFKRLRALIGVFKKGYDGWIQADGFKLTELRLFNAHGALAKHGALTRTA